MKKSIATVVLSSVLCAGCLMANPQQPQFRIPGHFIKHQFDGREWQVGHKAGNLNEFICEWVVPGESVNDWTELLTADIHFRDADISELVKTMQMLLAKDSKDFKTSILCESKDCIVFEWSHKGSGNWPAQREIKSIMRGTDGLYTLSYAVKESSFSQDKYNKWKTNIIAAKLEIRKQN